jgi:hypothetical protein
MIKNRQIFSIRETAETLVPDSTSRQSYAWGFGLIVLMVALTTLSFSRFPPQIPLYFTLPWGEARLAPKQMLYLLPGITFLFLMLNILIARSVRHLSPLLPRVLSVSTLVVASMILISLLGIAQSLVL